MPFIKRADVKSVEPITKKTLIDQENVDLDENDSKDVDSSSPKASETAQKD